jgi:hypothetical protein
MNRIFVLFSVLLLVFYSWGQNQRIYEFDIHYGRVIPHIPSIQNIAPSRPAGFQLHYGELMQDSLFTSAYHIRLERGYLLNYTNYQLPFLGSILATAYYLKPRLIEYKGIGFNFHFALGLSYSTKPFDEFKNNQNYTYSTHINLFASLGPQLSFKLSPRLSLDGAAYFNHISNGGLVKPNSGINWTSGHIGFTYLPQQQTDMWKPRNYLKKAVYPVEVTTFFSRINRDTATARVFTVAGVALQVNRRKKLHGWGLGGEFAYDNLYEAETLRKDNVVTKPWIYSGFINHDFLFGRFIFNQQIGVYGMPVYTAYLSGWYMRFGLQYYVTPKVGIGTNIKTHLTEATFADARVTYRLF